MSVAEATSAVSAFRFLKAETAGSVAVIWLNRPEARNALNEALRLELRQALTDAENDQSVRAVILAGEGKNFCAGADIRELQDRQPIPSTWPAYRLDTLIESMSKPVILGLHGYAFGGGMELALACTFRIAADDLKCGFPEIKLGVFPALGGTQRLPRIVGEARALDLMLTGRTIDAQEALAMGLVSRVVPAADLRSELMTLAQQIAAGPPIATRVIIEATRRAFDMGRTEGIDYERRLFGVVCGSEDKKEGVAAWIEKRPPKFVGR